MSTEILPRFPASLKNGARADKHVGGTRLRSVVYTNGEYYYQCRGGPVITNLFFPHLENGKNVNSQNPLLRPPTLSSPAGVTALGAWPRSGPPPLAAKLGASVRASADKEQAAAARGGQPGGGGGQRRAPGESLPHFYVTAALANEKRDGGGFPLRLPPSRLFKRYSGECRLGAVGGMGEMKIKGEK